MSGKNKKITPIRGLLRPESTLLACVQDYLGAVKDKHRIHLANVIKSAFADSLETDENLKARRDLQNRWDYLLGHQELACVIGLEPHSAKDEEVKTVIKKKRKALEQLRPHLRDGCRVAEWYWVASGKNRFLDTEKTRRLLDQNGICFVCPELAQKDLEKLSQQLKPISPAERRQR